MKKLVFSLLFFSSVAFTIAENPNNPNPLIENLKKLHEIQWTKYYERHYSDKSSTDQFKEEAKIRNNIVAIVEDNPQLIEPETVEPHYFPWVHKTDCPPLAIAAHMYRGEDTVRYLLRRSANPNPDCKQCPLPLIQASKGFVHECEPKIIYALLEHKADPFKKDPKYNISPFEYALKEADSKALEVYLHHEFIREKINSSSFSTNDNNKTQTTALRSLINQTAFSFFRDVTRSIELLHESGADIHEIDSEGNTLLHSAAYHRHSPQTIILLHSLGININKKNNMGQTPLHTLIISHESFVPHNTYLGPDSDNLINLFLGLGVDANSIDHNGETALFKFFRECGLHPLNFDNILKLWHATDKSIQNNKGETVLDIIKQRYLSLEDEIAKNSPNEFEALGELKTLQKFLSKNNLLMAITGNNVEQNETL